MNFLETQVRRISSSIFGQDGDETTLTRDIFTLVGLVYILYHILGLIRDLWHVFKIYFVFQYISWPWSKNWTEKYGKWAVITAATDGIGKEFSRQLAQKGMNIYLMGRSQKKLDKIGEEIIKDYGVSVKILEIDFTKTFEIYKKVNEELKKLEIGLLVNNVEVSPSHPVSLTETDPLLIWNNVQVNVGAVTMMTRIVLPQMKSREKGGIINISSFQSFEPTPFAAAYSASKVYINYLSKAVKMECTDYFDIPILCLTPPLTSTTMSWFNTPPKNYVKQALATFSHTDICMGSKSSGLWYGIHSMMPRKCWPAYFRLCGNIIRENEERKRSSR